MKIFHGFTFFNELELLTLKFEELWDVVDVFLLIESPLTFSGLKKPLCFQDHRDMFKTYHEKIYHVVQQVPIGPDPWLREKFQRNVILNITRKLSTSGDDVLINSDMDEIVSASSVRRWLAGETDFKPTALMMRMYYYYLNNFAVDSPWAGGKIMRVNDDISQTLSELRYNDTLPVIDNGGWHFSFLGDTSRIQTKVLSYAHNDLFHFVSDTSKVKECLKTGQDLFDRGILFKRVEIDETYPEYIRQNPSLWNDFVMKPHVKD